MSHNIYHFNTHFSLLTINYLYGDTENNILISVQVGTENRISPFSKDTWTREKSSCPYLCYNRRLSAEGSNLTENRKRMRGSRVFLVGFSRQGHSVGRKLCWKETHRADGNIDTSISTRLKCRMSVNTSFG